MTIVGGLLLALMLVGSCDPTGPPDETDISNHLRLLNRQLSALHEEVAAARTPSNGPIVLLLVSLILPWIVAVWLLTRAERSVIGESETIRILSRAGLAEPVIRCLMTRPSQKQREMLPEHSDATLPLARPRERHRPRRRRRRRKRE